LAQIDGIVAGGVELNINDVPEHIRRDVGLGDRATGDPRMAIHESQARPHLERSKRPQSVNTESRAAVCGSVDVGAFS
jgi:hypothetical protein